ncbi:MAG: putative uracil-DNA glycosylase [Thermoleophilia bacterium]|nr:putative uracil-DNA glycosylase [Thermoleophilia bacterium]
MPPRSELIDDPVTSPSAIAPALRDIPAVGEHVSRCVACPRLVEWREGVARDKRAAYADQEYWGRPVPGFGDPEAGVLVVGLAPAAHGANRTGRMFTGDRSGDWLFRALHRAGLASQPESVDREDGMLLDGAFITAAARCAPPANKLQPDEVANCQPWIERELDLLTPHLKVAVCLGAVGFHALWKVLGAHPLGAPALPRPRPKFAHGLEVRLESGLVVLGSFHVSQQNTFTGRLTEPMLDAVFARAVELAS